jgi:phospholipid transport system substrate-binding protein
MRAALVLLAALELAAAPPPDGAGEAVRVTLSKAQQVVGGTAERNEKLASLQVLARELLDARTMARRAMGKELATRSAEEQEEFLGLFEELIERAYLNKLLLFRKPEFAYGDAELRGEVTIVPTRILSAKDEYFVNYEMSRRDGRWLATDVVIEGISLTRNYRSQFQTILRRQSFEELLGRMRRTTRRLGAPAP